MNSPVASCGDQSQRQNIDLSYIGSNSDSWRSLNSCLYSFSRPWFLTYSLTDVSLPFCPTVLMKYPSVENSPPRKIFLTEGTRRNISRAVMLSIVRAIFAGLK